MKLHTNLSIDAGLLDQAKARGINLSALLQDSLRAELMFNENNVQEIELRINELTFKRDKLEKDFIGSVAKLDGELKQLKNKLIGLKDNEGQLDSEEFLSVKKRFKIVCVDKNYNLSPQNLRAWRGIFKRDARVTFGDNDLLNLMDSFRD